MVYNRPQRKSAGPGLPPGLAGNVSVKFLRRHQSYNAGEVAGFGKNYADWLVASRIAQFTPATTVDRGSPIVEK